MVATGAFVDAFTVRYFIPLLTFPLYVSALHAAVILRRRITKRVTLTISLALIVLCIPSFSRFDQFKRYTDSYQPPVQCLDRSTSLRGLKSGVAHYWDVLYIMMLSRRKVLHVLNTFQPFHWMGNTRWYERFPPEFIIYDPHAPGGWQMSERMIMQTFGRQAETFMFPVRTIFVYNRLTDTLTTYVQSR